MLAPDAGNDTEPRCNHAHERRQLTGMVRPDFQRSGLVRPVQFQQGHRHADVVVEARFAPERLEPLAQHRCQQLFRCRLAV